MAFLPVRPFGLFCTGVLLWGIGMAHADTEQDEARHLRESGDVLPLEALLNQLRRQFPGKVLEVEMEKEHGRIIYEVEMLGTDGVVRKWIIDAKTGETLKIKLDD